MLGRVLFGTLLSFVVVACGAFDKENPPPNPVAEEARRNVGDFVRHYCMENDTTSEQKAMVARLRQSVFADAEIDLPPYDEATCYQIGNAIVASRSLKLRLREIGDTTAIDLEPLAVFSVLTSLNMLDSELTDDSLAQLAPLKHLTHLYILDAPYVSDLSAISENHPKLAFLQVRGTALASDPIDLSRLTSLLEINLSYNDDLSIFPKLPKTIAKVTMEDCKLQALPDMRDYTSLERLSLARNPLIAAPLVSKSTRYIDLYGSLDREAGFLPLLTLADRNALHPEFTINIGVGSGDGTRALRTILLEKFPKDSVTIVSPDLQNREEK